MQSAVETADTTNSSLTSDEERYLPIRVNVLRVPTRIYNYTVPYTTSTHVDEVSRGIIFACVLVHAVTLFILLRAIVQSQESELVKQRIKIYIQMICASLLNYSCMLALSRNGISEIACMLMVAVLSYSWLVYIMLICVQNIAAILDASRLKKKHRALAYWASAWVLPLLAMISIVLYHSYKKELFDLDRCWYIIDLSDVSTILAQALPLSVFLTVMLVTLTVHVCKSYTKPSDKVKLILRTSIRMNVLMGLSLLSLVTSYNIWMYGKYGLVMEYVTIAMVIIQTLTSVLVIVIYEPSIKNSLVGEAREDFDFKQEEPPKLFGPRYIP